jgi:hypothetical protein
MTLETNGKIVFKIINILLLFDRLYYLGFHHYILKNYSSRAWEKTECNSNDDQ